MTLREAALDALEKRKEEEREALQRVVEENARTLMEIVRKISPEESFEQGLLVIRRDEEELVYVLKALDADITFLIPSHHISSRTPIQLVVPCSVEGCEEWTTACVGVGLNLDLVALGEALTSKHRCSRHSVLPTPYLVTVEGTVQLNFEVEASGEEEALREAEEKVEAFVERVEEEFSSPLFEVTLFPSEPKILLSKYGGFSPPTKKEV